MFYRGLLKGIFFCATPLFAKVQIPDFLEQGQLQKALPAMQEVVLRYERARKHYLEKGPEAFVNSLSEKLKVEEKRELIQLLSKLPELPKVSLQNDILNFDFESGKRMEFKVAEVILGRFNSGNYSKRYNFNASPKENWDALKIKEKKDTLSAFQKFLDSVFFPMAFANDATGRDIGVVTIGSLTGIVVLPKLGYVDYSPQGGHGH